MEPTQSSEMSAYNVRTPGKYPEDNFSLLQHGESLKTRSNEVSSCHLWEIPLKMRWQRLVM
jgi:hypothetical protein